MEQISNDKPLHRRWAACGWKMRDWSGGCRTASMQHHVLWSSHRPLPLCFGMPCSRWAGPIDRDLAGLVHRLSPWEEAQLEQCWIFVRVSSPTANAEPGAVSQPATAGSYCNSRGHLETSRQPESLACRSAAFNASMRVRVRMPVCVCVRVRVRVRVRL